MKFKDAFVKTRRGFGTMAQGGVLTVGLALSEGNLSDGALPPNGALLERLGYYDQTVQAQNRDVGGNNFRISADSRRRMVHLKWDAGSEQAGYALFRTSFPGGITTLVPPLGLPSTTTSYDDQETEAQTVYCYQLVALTATGSSLGASDLLCTDPSSVLASEATVLDYYVGLGGTSMASFTWTATIPQSVLSYYLVRQPLDGGLRTSVPVDRLARGTTDDTKGVPTCYSLYTLLGDSGKGYTGLVCAFPGVSSLSSYHVGELLALFEQR